MTVYALARNEARWSQIKEKFKVFTSATILFFFPH